MAEIINILKPTTALEILQDNYALLDLSGEIRIVDLQQIAEVMSGDRAEISFYKRSEFR